MMNPRADWRLWNWGVTLLMLCLIAKGEPVEYIDVVETAPKAEATAAVTDAPVDEAAPLSENEAPEPKAPVDAASPAEVTAPAVVTPAATASGSDVKPAAAAVAPASAKQAVPKPVVKAPQPVKLPPESTNRSHGYYGESSFSKSQSSKDWGEWSGKTADAYKKFHDFMGDRFHIGLRTASYTLDENTKQEPGEDPHYLGSIDELVDAEDSGVLGLTLGFYPIRNFGVEYRHDKVQARAFTDSADNHPDGNFVLDGPIILAVGRLPLDQVVTAMHKVFDWPPEGEGVAYEVAARFIPYVGVGAPQMDGTFDADTWWGQGFGSPAAWEAEGRPPSTTNGHTRQIRIVGENLGTYYTYGLSVRIVDAVYIDISQSRLDAELEAEFYLDGGELRDTGTIPMGYVSSSVGIRYYF
jgi:hypothetical protein